jgi:hypothetical protein
MLVVRIWYDIQVFPPHEMSNFEKCCNDVSLLNQDIQKFQPDQMTRQISLDRILALQWGIRKSREWITGFTGLDWTVTLSFHHLDLALTG